MVGGVSGRPGAQAHPPPAGLPTHGNLHHPSCVTYMNPYITM